MLFKVNQLQLASPASELIESYPIICLETLIRVYYLRHSFEFADGFLTYFLSLLANVTSESIKSSHECGLEQPEATLRSTLILCLLGLHDQAQHAFIADVVGRILLSRLDNDELDTYRTIISPAEENLERPIEAEDTRSDFSLSISGLDIDSSELTVQNLLKQQRAGITMSKAE